MTTGCPFFGVLSKIKDVFPASRILYGAFSGVVIRFGSRESGRFEVDFVFPERLEPTSLPISLDPSFPAPNPPGLSLRVLEPVFPGLLAAFPPAGASNKALMYNFWVLLAVLV